MNKLTLTKASPVTPGDASPEKLLLLAVTQNLPIDILEKLMALKERWDAKIAKADYIQALSKFQMECPPLKKTAKVSYQSKGGVVAYMFIPLGDIMEQIKKTMFSNGLTAQWRINEHEKQISVTCVIAHIGGHYEETSMSAASDSSGSKNEIQAKGSTVTYLQRYTLSAMLGLASVEDNDGDNSASAAPKLPAIDNDRTEKAVLAFQEGKITIEAIKKRFILTPEQEAKFTTPKDSYNGAN